MAARIESINAAYVELAREHGALLLDLANHPGAAQRQSWHIDRIHPGVAGHLILAEGFAALLRDVGFRVGQLERTEPAPIEARHQIGWLLRHGTPWLAKQHRPGADAHLAGGPPGGARPGADQPDGSTLISVASRRSADEAPTSRWNSPGSSTHRPASTSQCSNARRGISMWATTSSPGAATTAA